MLRRRIGDRQEIAGVEKEERRGWPAMGLGRPFYRPEKERMITRVGSRMILAEDEVKSATGTGDPRRPARWQCRGALGMSWRGASGQAEAAQGGSSACG